MKSKKIMTAMLLCFSFFGYSQNISVEYAKNIAMGQFQQINPNKSNKVENITAFKSISKNDIDFLYVFNFESGFVITSTYDCFAPIIGYSNSSTFPMENTPEIIQDWLSTYVNGMDATIQNADVLVRDSKWDEMSQKTNNNLIAGIPPLMTSRWNQGGSYNDSCPEHPAGPNGRCYAGCLATAIGQVMYYYKYPQQGTGSSYYEHPHYGILQVNYGNTTYNWQQMGNTATTGTRGEISKLLYHCGVSVDMNYSPNSSGSHTELAVNSLRNHFNYAPEIAFIERSSYSPSFWRRIIIDNLYQHKPVIYSGSGGSGGHAWVCDGVNDSLYFHMNWGWSGSGNGYFLLNELNSGNGDFSSNQGAVINIAPQGRDFCFQPKEYFETEMTFSDGSGNNPYKNNTDCYYYIRSDSAKVRVNFTYFDTEENVDILSIYDGEDETAPLIGQFSGNTKPADFYSSGPNLFLRFKTNETVQKQGWELRYIGLGLYAGIDDFDFSETIKIYPNPASDLINVELKKDDIVEIYNVNGSQVKHISKVVNDVLQIDIRDLPKGVYILKIKRDNVIANKKMIKL